MKYSLVAVAFAAAASAQTLADIPSCALPCLDSAVTSKTNCAISDIACVCKDFNTVQAAATSCVISKCGAKVATEKVLPASEALCKNPSSGGSSSAAGKGSSAPESTAAASSGYSSAPASSGYPSSAATSPTTVAASSGGYTPSSTTLPSVGTTGLPGKNGTSPTGTGPTSVPTGPSSGASQLGFMGLAAMLGLAALAL